ncbi:hypothetical protein KQI30_03065 [Clostridium bornimense]|uniref:glycosyl hydrolase family 18 protein n=1 Tax=Clostridium bornimense TaxID=1216932 RepID=UPI001C12870A|nr:glycosyl hydrolase family 18 protein [Clostridium bornimense]MBU5315258.1 hypothetical protein [Clostridium bornimense]
MKRFIGLVLCIALFITIIGCNLNKSNGKVTFHGWIVDWDFQGGIEEARNSSHHLDNLSYFGVYFNKDGLLYKNESFSSNIDTLAKEYDKLYITVVNDVINEDNSIEKDSDVIHSILNSNDKKERHIAELLNLADDKIIEGIELDYEKIQDSDWKKYISFIDEVGTKLANKGKKLRVVLQSSAPVNKLKFPTEYEYIVMVYNLYGNKTKPGPKADKDYVESVCNKFKGKLENLQLAFSLSGAEWLDNGEYKSLSRNDITQIRNGNSVDITRAKESDALTFSYRDEKNNFCEVWYSDDETIKSWMNIAKSKGIYKFSIWRLGGNI